MDKTIFKEIRAILDKYDEIVFFEDPNEHSEDFKWLETYIFDMAKALYKELPDSSKIAKILCIMNDDEIKIKIE